MNKRFHKNNALKRTVVAAAVSSTLAMGAAIPAYAQEGEALEFEEVVVTGIRKSLNRASEIKENSDAFVDAISAEGIGDFPDTNLAEALQRISGVAIDRSNGEGEFVSVRGFGPEFNTVLLNGRQLPTTNGGRDFSFDTIASELVNRLDVFKTSPVSLQSGGIGSTINVHTPRPLDNPGQKTAISVDALYEEASSEVTPRLFASYSNTFSEDTVGVYLSANYQRRDTAIESIETRGYNIRTVGQDLQASQFSGQAPADGTRVFAPINFDQFVNFEERERVGANAAIQWQASPDLLFTVDALYTELNVESDVEAFGNWFGTNATLSNLAVDENNTVTQLTRNAAGGGRADFIQRTFNRPDELVSFGFNADWDVSDNLNVKWDVAVSEATSANGGGDVFVVAGFDQTVNFAHQGAGLVPTLTGTDAALGTDFSRPRAHVTLRNGARGAGGRTNANGDFEDDIFETRLDFEWIPSSDGVWTSLKGGALFSSREKSNRTVQTEASSRQLYTGYFLDLPDSFFSTFDQGSFLSGRGGGGLPQQFIVFDPEEVIAFLESPATAALRDNLRGFAPGTTQAILDANNGFAAAVQPSSFDVEEDIFEAYVDFGFAGEVFNRELRATAGLRYVTTDVKATGGQQVLLDLQPLPFDPTALISTFDPTPGVRVVENDYSEVLPNLTMRYQVSDDVVARFGYSRTLTRPSPVNMAPRVNFTTLRPNNLLANGGNPNLEAFLSDNIDLSLEWYFGEARSASISYFRKDTDGFIVNGVETVNFPIASNPAGANFQVSLPVNGEAAVVDGFEIGFNYAFDSGFGIQANATFVDSDRDFNFNEFLATGNSFGILGVSDTQNIVLYYENDKFEARVAFNHRDGFLEQLANATGGLPIFVEDVDQSDARISYQINDDIQVFVEGINLTNEEFERRGAFRNQVINIVETGSRYSIGVRASF